MQKISVKLKLSLIHSRLLSLCLLNGNHNHAKFYFCKNGSETVAKVVSRFQPETLPLFQSSSLL